ncbi:alpha-beta hydrolase superfamily lysophospholipase [Croceifilum oryzae]|uniref:Alpha-beta hydrolase superfamily lysophospholipase n=1 Tax=Croceifilum oryzae TaxID=1553429 RepID=A0AAJ1TIN4_9BACL|nr:alpha/beta hydrolase [Croceifilum oryzae]MDQ0416826.1 alpha-beta hydrolase superfamily lysophospholipase [Croceifilum oryzae]
MNIKEGYIHMTDGTEVYLYTWLPTETPRGIVQIAHGMTEHIGVYNECIEALLTAGFGVYAHDHRGHGKTAKQEDDYGHFEPDIGWDQTVMDIIFISNLIRDKHSCPLFLLGHSMGSFLARRAVQLQHHICDGLLLSGTGGNPGLLGKIGHLLATLEMKVRGVKTKSNMLKLLSFGTFNSQFKPKRTDFDWLSSDASQVDRYIADPACGFTCTTSFYRELCKGVLVVNQLEEYKKTPKNLPIYLFSGELDPVGDKGRGVQEVYDTYRKCGVMDVTMKLYKNKRHEMLHEENREEVFQDLIDWITQRLNEQTLHA